MASLSRVPCLELSTENINQHWPQLQSSLNDSHFVAIDLELSGLGPRNKLNVKSVDDRYHAICEAAKTRSILSLGLSFFKLRPLILNDDENAVKSISYGTTSSNLVDIDPDDLAALTEETNQEWQFSVENYNIICLSDDEYVVEPETLRFLVSHGFDFNRQASCGLPYHAGNDKEGDERSQPSLRKLFADIVKQKLPLILHNGLIDLVFLYQNFYCELPNDLQSFIADLVELFPSGIYDTKYISDFHARLGRSFLEYLFYERQRFNLERVMNGEDSVVIHFSSSSNEFQALEYLEFRDLKTKLFTKDELEICKDYGYHGWCKNNAHCTKSHNIDHILDDKKKYKGKRKNKFKELCLAEQEIEQEDIGSDLGNGDSLEKAPRGQAKQGIHKAGYDAFMTGYCFCIFLTTFVKRKPKVDDDSNPIKAPLLGIKELVNNIYLVGKDQPLRIVPSSFAKTSAPHKNKIAKLR